MKELSTEEKAKRYDEAIKRAREKYAMFEGMKQGDALEDVFPELKESEDEKIRKAIVSGMTTLKEIGKETFATININDCISWLEKQGEQKPAWSEEDEKRAERLHGWLDTLVNYIHHDAIISLDLRRERMQQVERLKTWLKSLKDRVGCEVNCTTKKEWSEEDEWKFSDILALLRGGENCHYNTPDLFDFLKSLKGRYTWKPSDEQMDALETAVSSLQSTALESLYQKFKKL